MAEQDPVQPIKAADFYTIQFSPKCVEWVYLMNKLLHSIEITAWNDYLIYTHEETGDHVYRLKKDRYPAEQVAKMLGMTVQAIHKLDIIYLDPPAANKGIPAATVEGWGTA